ncbi:MAG TPA: DUF1592 domain-containing protein [Polyangiaceae bacterium]|nr:DUF1592 domain-containing protein [Polyangiaceae bacterium]
MIGLLWLACSGGQGQTHNFEGDASTGRGGSSVDGGAANATPGGASEGDPLAPAEPIDCTGEEAPPAPLRRLTQREYENTVFDLLGVVVPIGDFPADPVGGGFDNNAAALGVSPLHAEKYLEAAEALAQEALQSQWSALVPCTEADAVDQDVASECARDFVQSFGRRAYRRPLSESEIEQLLRAYEAGREGAGFRQGIELAVQAALQSPSFLYRFEFGAGPATSTGFVELSEYELASRLSYFFWGSMPTDELLDAAHAGELSQPERRLEWAHAMLDDPRAIEQLAEFHRQWLGLRELGRLQKDSDIYPDLDDELRAALAAELPAFVAHVWHEDRRLASLLTAPVGFVTAPLAALYGVETSESAEPIRVELDPNQRAGLLTQAAVLAVHSLPDQSSPVSRGKLVREKLLCQPPPAPPANANITPPEVDPTKSTRERFAEHTAEASCKACHELMDPIGFVFESYDALGRYRDSDGEVPIDSAGWISGSRDADGELANARELAERLAASEQVRDCVATQWFRFGFGRFEAPADACSIAEAQEIFAASDGDLRELLVALTQTESFLHRRAIEAD